MRIQIVASLTVILLAAGLAAQQPASSLSGAGAASTTGTQQVVLPVTVRDKKGELVPSLDKSQLTLTQDGRPQSITSLTRGSDLPFKIGLLVDTSQAMRNSLDPEEKAAEGFVDGFLPADTKNQAFLIHFDREVELLEDFTSDKAKLDQELEEMTPTRQEKSQDEGPETTDSPSQGHGRHNGTQLYDAIFLASDEVMKGKTGRKALIVFSDGADRGSKETMNDAVDAADRAGVEVYTIFFKGQPDRTPGSQMPGNNRRGGMGYPGGYPGGGYPGGYPGGGYPGGGRRQPEPTSATGIDGKRIMMEIAQRTGGHAYEAHKTADLAAIYKLIDEELNGQYLLTYTPDKPDTDGEFHKVAVTTSNKDYSIATREGYYGKSGGQ
jgi:VWFA-related protein